MTRLRQFSALWVIVLLASACTKKSGEMPAAEEKTEQPEGQPSQVQRITLQIEATFDTLSDGARIVAPVALDRRYQKITKTEHVIEPKQKGMSGVPERSLDKENLIFVSGPISVPKATYKANYEVEIRSMKPGVFDSIAGQAYGEFNDPKLKAALKAVATPAADPHGVVAAAFKTAKAQANVDAYTLASSFSEALKQGGVPHRLVQGLLLRDGSAKPHVWTEVLLPQLGWAPFDPYSARSVADDDTAYRGQHPPDRLRVLFGDAFALAKKADRPELALKSPFLSPRALIPGAEGSVKEVAGKVTYTVASPQ